MGDTQRPDDRDDIETQDPDVEGHRVLRVDGDDDVEGHRVLR
jgi:hypothetical protein